MVTTLRAPLMTRADDDESMRLGIFYPNTPGLHVASSLVRQENPDAMDLRAHIEAAQACEEIGLDFIFLPDRWSPYGPACSAVGFQDPMIHAPMLAAALSAVTRDIGIVTTMHTTYHHPVHVARIGANLDALTKGRWGLNIVTGFTANEGELFGLDAIPHDERYAMADEFLDAVRELWAGEHVDFRGKWFTFSVRL
jgi:FMNH2-dependent dimethyl sulfone monooxygenase